jgi:serine/threonine-protein kinase HipA
MEEVLIIEIYVDHCWKECGKVIIFDSKKSFYSRSHYDYNLEYYFEHVEDEGTVGSKSVSLCIELGPTKYPFENWSGFLLDLMPQGFARDIVCKREEIVNNQENDFLILKSGAVNPIGNLRIQNKKIKLEKDIHNGFDKKDLIERNESFLDYAASYGAIVVGASGAQGVAPKFLLNTDQSNKWHCDGAISESKIESMYLVKMKRGRTENDVLLLEAENLYMKIAQDLSLNANHGLVYEDGLLFIPRFDRKIEAKKLVCYGMESFSSALGHNQFGKSEFHETILELINKVSTHKKEDIKEYIIRDFLNIVMGNTDNHLRNSAFIKYSTSEVRLSPLYDFAPMVIDPEIIARVCKWRNESGYIPDFSSIDEELFKYDFSNEETIEFFKDCLIKIKRVDELFIKYEINGVVRRLATRLLNNFISSLELYINERASSEN